MVHLHRRCHSYLVPTNLCPKPEEIVVFPLVGAWHFKNDRSFTCSTYTFRRVSVYFIFRIPTGRSSKRQCKDGILLQFALAAPCAEFFTQMAKMQPEDNDPPVRANRYLTRLERQQIAAQLWEEVNMATGEPLLAFGAIGRCAKKIGVKAPAISKIWKHMNKENFAKGIMAASPVKQNHSSSLLYCRSLSPVLQR